MPGNAGRPRFQAIVHSHAPSGESETSNQSFVPLPIVGAIKRSLFWPSEVLRLRVLSRALGPHPPRFRQCSLDRQRRSRLSRRSPPALVSRVLSLERDPVHLRLSRSGRAEVRAYLQPNGPYCLSDAWLRHSRRVLRSPEWIASSGYQRLRQLAFLSDLRRSATRRAGHGRALQKLRL